MVSATFTDEADVVLQATVQDILIVTSAGISFIKSILSVGTYTYMHVLLAVLELACTAFALALFVLNDLLGEDGKPPPFGDDLYIFLLAFCSACIAEIMDVAFTFQTVHTYKKISQIVSEGKLPYDALLRLKKQAKCFYLGMLSFGLISYSLIPIIAFWRAGWVVAYFAPSPFSSQNSMYLLVSNILLTAGQLFTAAGVTLTVCSEIGMAVIFLCCQCFNSLLLAIPAYVLIYVVLARVEEGPEAGSLCYLMLINAFQMVEMSGENMRLFFWIGALLDIENTEAEESRGDSTDLHYSFDDDSINIDFDEPDI